MITRPSLAAAAALISIVLLHETAVASTSCFSPPAAPGGTTRLCISDDGVITSLQGPAGVEHLVSEGYALCSASGATVHGYDAGDTEAGLGAPAIEQPNGPGTFPITITRDTTDGVFRLTMVFTRRTLRQDNEIHMRVTNLSGAPVEAVWVSRFADVNASGAASNRFARTADTVLSWIDGAYGLELRSRAAVPHTTQIETAEGYATSRTGCLPSAAIETTGTVDGTARVTFDLGVLGAGKGRNILVSYARF